MTKELDRVPICAYCGKRFNATSQSAADKLAREHIKTCPKHPMAALKREVFILKVNFWIAIIAAVILGTLLIFSSAQAQEPTQKSFRAWMKTRARESRLYADSMTGNWEESRMIKTNRTSRKVERKIVMIIKVLHEHDGLEEVYECHSYYLQRKLREEQRKDYTEPDTTVIFTVCGGGRKEPHDVQVNLRTHEVYITNDMGQTIDRYHMPR